MSRPLPRHVQVSAVRTLAAVHPDDWNRRDLTSDLGRVVDAALAEELARHVLRNHPRPPRPRLALATAVGAFRVEVALESEAPGRLVGRTLADIGDVARLLDSTVPELEWFADLGGWLRTKPPPLRHYKVERIPKRGGVRLLEIPKPRLREAQRRVLRHVLDPAEPHSAATGFRRGGSVHGFAQPHTGAAIVLRVDLRQCFATVTYPRVRGVFSSLGYPRGVAKILAGLCTTATSPTDLRGLDAWSAAVLRARHLPQGAPTSPSLANLAMRRLDARVAGLARARGLEYTRYGDDLALSGQMDSGLVAAVVARIVASEGFEVNPAKTRVMHRHGQQELAGVVVNERAQAPRAEYDTLRALLHNAARFGAESQNRSGVPDFRAYVYGRIAWVGQGNSVRRERLLYLADRVRW